MRDLEETLAQQRRESEQVSDRIRQETTDRILHMQQQAEAAFQRKLNETSEAYAERVRQFQEDVIRQSSEQLGQLREQAEQINRQIRQTMQELEACSQELRAQLQMMKDETRQQDRAFRQKAEQAQAEAENARLQAEATPHTFFCPQEFDIISGHIQDIRTQIDMGMYQAAVSDANCIALEFQLLRTKVEHAFTEWMRAFDDYRQILSALNQRLAQFESTAIETSEGTFRMSAGEMNFWSTGTYAPLAQQIRAAHDTFCGMDQDQILEYLRGRAGTNRRAIFDLVTQGRKWEDQLAAVINCIVSERIMSDQRLTIAQTTADFLEELNYQVAVEQFLPPRPAIARQSWYIAGPEENPLDSFDLHLLLGAQNRLKLRIVPRRQNGLAVSNEIFLSLDMRTATDSATERMIAQSNVGRITELCRQRNLNTHIQYIPSCDTPDHTIGQQERFLNTPPNPSEQIRYLERKYL